MQDSDRRVNLADLSVNKRLDEKGPYAIDDLIKPFDCDSFGICRNVSPITAARVVREMPGRFTYQQAFDFCDYHLCDGCDDVDMVLEELLKKTDCTRDERDELLMVFATEKLIEAVEAQDRADAGGAGSGQDAGAGGGAAGRGAGSGRGAGAGRDRATPSFGEMLLGAVLGNEALQAIANRQADAASGEPAFHDFNNAWDSNNDHNWEADGDYRWDDLGEGPPGGE